MILYCVRLYSIKGSVTTEQYNQRNQRNGIHCNIIERLCCNVVLSVKVPRQTGTEWLIYILLDPKEIRNGTWEKILKYCLLNVIILLLLNCFYSGYLMFDCYLGSLIIFPYSFFILLISIRPLLLHSVFPENFKQSNFYGHC